MSVDHFKQVKNDSSTRKRILYIGGFELPDKNAAAQRVIGIARAINELGHEVYFLNYTNSVKASSWKKYFGFKCYETKKRNLVNQITGISDAIKIIKDRRIDCVIMYNYPAIAMLRLLNWCKKSSVKCYADVTEWYVTKGISFYALIKTWDSETRMKKLHFKTDGVIAISEFLYQYYKDKVPTVKIPPIVDIQDDKWGINLQKKAEPCIFVYAGSPSAQKECLDKIVEAVENTNHAALLQIIGITKEQYEVMYQVKYKGEKTEFLGRIEHIRVIELIKKANWSIVIRENNRTVKAGFPTKVVESISCGTPVIANRFSNIEDYLGTDNSIICDMNSIDDAVNMAFEKKINVDTTIFDYRNYVDALRDLFECQCSKLDWLDQKE